jgi:hypothetical protein
MAAIIRPTQSGFCWSHRSRPRFSDRDHLPGSAGNATLPLVSAYYVFEQTWSPPMPCLFEQRFGTEARPLTRSFLRECLVATSRAAQITAAGQPR